MLDRLTHPNVACRPPAFGDVQFYTIELAPLPDGQVFVSVQATYVDEHELELIGGTIVDCRAATLREALAVVQTALISQQSKAAA